MCIVCYGSVSVNGGPGAVDQYHQSQSAQGKRLRRVCSPLNAVNDLGRMTVSLSGQWGRIRGYASRTTSIFRFLHLSLFTH